MSAARSFAQRLSPLIAAFGVACVPGLLTRYQRRLGLTNNEVVYLLHVLDHRWDGDAWPWVSVGQIHEANGAGERSIRDWRASLVKKGYLVLRRREHVGRGRAADEHDLTRLFAALEAFAMEPTPRRAALEARQQLPEPSFYTGMPVVPDADVVCRQRRPGLRTQRVQAKALRDVHPAETGRAEPAFTLPVSSTITLPVSAGRTQSLPLMRLKEPGKKNPLCAHTRAGGENFSEDDDEADVAPVAESVNSHPGAAAAELVDGLYRGLGVATATCTPRMRKRELAIARDLVAVGATPSEVEAYARETNGPGRRAAVDMAAFERDRASWLARRHGPSDHDGPRFVDLTGQPPSWEKHGTPSADKDAWTRDIQQYFARKGRTWSPKVAS